MNKLSSIFVAGICAIFLPAILAAEEEPTLTYSLGQRFEPIVKDFEEIKSNFERTDSGLHYPGFVATLSNKNINNGVPLGVTFASPLKLKLNHERYSILFPAGKFLSTNFNDRGELHSLSLNPQLKYSTPSETLGILSHLSGEFENAGWKMVRSSGESSRWMAGWVSAALFVRNSSECQSRIDSGENEPSCQLVELEITKRSKLTGRILKCGEIDANPFIAAQEAPGSHTGQILMMDPLENPVFKDGCPNIHAALGKRFGVSVEIKGNEEGELIQDLVTRVTHPPFSSGGRVDEWKSPIKIGEPRYAGWIFEEDTELVPGEWIIEIVLGTEVLARQVFSVKI